MQRFKEPIAAREPQFGHLWSILSKAAATSWYFWGEQNYYKLVLYLTTKYVFENLGGAIFG